MLSTIAILCLLFGAVADANEPGAAILRVLNRIVIPKVDFQEVSVEEAVDFARMRSIELDSGADPTRKGVSILILKPSRAREQDVSGLGLERGEDPGQIRITYVAEKVTLPVLLIEIAKRARLDLHITSVGIVFCPSRHPPFPNGKAARGEIIKTLYKVSAGTEPATKANKSE